TSWCCPTPTWITSTAWSPAGALPGGPGELHADVSGAADGGGAADGAGTGVAPCPGARAEHRRPAAPGRGRDDGSAPAARWPARQGEFPQPRTLDPPRRAYHPVDGGPRRGGTGPGAQAPSAARGRANGAPPRQRGRYATSGRVGAPARGRQ